jgi:transcriptional regulator with PAS, ATPase and Fis domain
LNTTYEPASKSSVLTPGRLPAMAFQNIVGSSESLRETITLACRVAAHSGVTVLLTGETGTGKELFARGIHYSTEQAGEPFVAINCAAIPANLLESELFGHERGAFSGANVTKRGLFEFAGNGTVFLDEVGELPADLQAKLLRVLEERKVRRVGALLEREVSCRIIAATNRDLHKLAGDGTFREDLYYRLAVITVPLPPLRERADDVPILARYFVEKLAREKGIRTKHISEATMDALRAYPWPGNVRELRNKIERAMIVAEGDTIHPAHIILERSRNNSEGWRDDFAGLPECGVTIEEMERRLIAATLARTCGNHSRTARMLGISRPRLMRKLRQYGIVLDRD